MRLERVGLKFVEENKRLEQQALAQAAAASFAGVTNGVPHTPTVDAARRVVEVTREHIERASAGHRRNDAQDLRPTLRQVMSEQRWGPAPLIPTAPSPVTLTRAELERAIIGINLQLTERRRDDAGLIAQRDQLAAQLHALPK